MKTNTCPTISLPLLFAVSLSAFALTPHSVNAQSALGLTAIPPRLDLTIQPGQAVTKEIKVRNESDSEKTITITTRDFIVTDDAGTPIQLENVPESENRWAAATWIQVSPSSFRLKPGETKSLNLTAIAPEKALPGGHYAMVLETPNREIALNQTGTSIQANVGTLVYLTVPGDITQDARIKSFSAPKLIEYGPVKFNTSITNLSDVHITPAGAINVTNWLGGKTARLNLENTNIFPYTSRDLENTLDKKFLFGHYRAQLVAAYGTAGGTLIATLFFWAVPWRLVFSLLFALISLVLLVLFVKSKDKLTASQTEIDDLEKELEDLKKKYKDRK